MNIVVFGKRGTGKTTWCKNHIRKSVLPCVVIDTMYEYGDVTIPVRIDEPLHYFKCSILPENEDEFDYIMQRLSRLKCKYGLNVYIDEIDYWSNVHSIPDNLARNLRYSRHYNLNIIMTVRNPSEINRRITAMSDLFIIYSISEPRYLDYFKSFNPELANRIRALKPYQHIKHYLVHHS